MDSRSENVFFLVIDFDLVKAGYYAAAGAERLEDVKIESKH